jgi:5-methylthioribose kinase
MQPVRRSDGGSFIVKQARESLERFPECQAPPARIALEAKYYEVTAPYNTEHVRPGVLDFDPENFVLVLEDLGDAESLDAALASGRDCATSLQRLARFLGAVHGATRDGTLSQDFSNDAMQRLHGEHIFALPYRENDFPRSRGLERCTARRQLRALPRSERCARSRGCTAWESAPRGRATGAPRR